MLGILTVDESNAFLSELKVLHLIIGSTI